MRSFLFKAIFAVLALGSVPYAFADSAQAPKSIRLMTVDELEKAGDAMRALKDFPEALRYFQEALRRDRRNASIHNKLGLTHVSNGDMDAARRSFENAIRHKPNYPDALNNLGVVYFKERYFSDAARYFSRAIALEETRAAFHVNLGVALFNQRRIEQAMMQYARALELDPEVLWRSSSIGITAQIAGPEDRGRFFFELARIQAQRDALEDCLRCLQLAKDNNYSRLADVYGDELFRFLWDDERLHEIVAPPAT